MTFIDTPATGKLALLIDGDNLPSTLLPVIMREASALGTVVIRRLYGHFGSAAMQRWQPLVLEHALTPVHVVPASKGKNATDMKLAIDAIDMLHERDLDGFCLASSDSDFTALASRIRENGLKVYGFGEQKATAPHVAACDRFFYCDLLQEEAQEPQKAAGGRRTALPHAVATQLRSAIEATANEDGWSQLGSVGSTMTKLMPDFDPRNYGYRKLSDLVAGMKGFELHKDRRNVRPLPKG